MRDGARGREDDAVGTTPVTPAAPGRPRDPGVDRRIAQAALDLFAEAGWAGFAMETVARRAGVGKASLYLRWSSKEAMLADAVTLRLARAADVDTGTLRGDLVELATQMLDVYGGETGRAALRLGLEAAAIPRVAEHYEEMRQAQITAARAIVRRGIDRGELTADTPVTLLLDTLAGGAMVHVMAARPPRPASRAPRTGDYATRLVTFLMRAVTTPAPRA
jgi:AcrR family transcriptional regulator